MVEPQELMVKSARSNPGNSFSGQSLGDECPGTLGLVKEWMKRFGAKGSMMVLCG